ncbi:MAG TPA: hypothetical protein VGT60_08620, partial [Candidatus Limnocylindria bacterium]|nr:hypothetical protein [Candidatus Limnocylindria bacterium]
GVDQRMSKAFTVSGGLMGATRATTSDLGVGGTASTIATDGTAGTREGLIDPAASGTRAIHDDAPADLRAVASTGDLSGVRAVNDVAPFGTTGTSAVEDPNSPEFGRGLVSTGDFAGNTRAVNDVAPFEGNVNAGATVDDPYSGQYQGVSPDFQARLSDHLVDAGDATSIRPINDVAPFEGNVNAAAADGAMLGDARLDPGIDSSHGDITTTNTGETGNEHGWG